MDKKLLLGLIIGIIFILVVSVGLLFFLRSREQRASTDETKPSTKLLQYDWSTMNEGPYKDKVSFATSTDLLNWEDSGKIIAEHASVPGAIVKNGTIYVYFVDVSEDGKPEQIALIKSVDNGSTWSEKKTVKFEGIGDKVPVDPAPFLLPDGRVRIYYFDINENRGSSSGKGTNKIYSAISSDGAAFKHEEGVRFEKEGIFDPDVEKVGDTWRMYVGAIPDNKVISATSADGLEFSEEGIAFASGSVPDEFFEDSTYYLFTAGIDIATSKDGTTFTKTGSSFRSKTGLTADPSVIKLPDGTFMMVYKTKDAPSPQGPIP